MQDDLTDAYYVCTKKSRLVERVALKNSIQIITLKLKNRHWHCQLRAITNTYM